ncbi:hypothetical protein IMSHALPRED_008871 [Imshaugia aleurites]|uniref:Uncharacterized protein n=1 Tax=Imshaugia aleurites TaxID=172621 RepID=A0A8H3FWR3_9LECA|nr:hypothetical protein IMSHALPRED_008871 [Imshaugia aleurites]
MPTSSTQPLPRPDYLKDTTTAFQNARTREIRAATNIFESGRLSLVPCGWCIKYNEACIVAPDVSGRCMSCSFKSKKTYECLAEGVKGGTSTSGTSSQVTTSVSVVLPIGGILPHRSSYSAIPPPATQANASQTAIPSFVPVNAGSSSHESTNPSGRRVPSKLKRKRTVSDPADAIETGAKRTRGHTDATMTESSYVYGPTNPNLASRAPAPAPISPTSGSVA